MKRFLKLIMCFAVLCAFLAGCSQKNKEALLKEAETVEWKDVSMDIALNQVAAKEKYEGMIVKFTGYIGEIYDEDYVELNWYEGSWMDQNIDHDIKLRATTPLRMDLNDEDVSKLLSGDKVTVVGVLSEISTGTAHLENAYLVE